MLEGTKVPASTMFISTGAIAQDDTDNDGVPDSIDPNPFETPTPSDSDGDGLFDDFEIVIFRTNPFDPDTDGDGFEDNLDYFPLNPGKWLEPLLPWIIGQDQTYIFIDTDINPGTGYRINSRDRSFAIGAEFMVKITGKYGHVLKRNLFKYVGDNRNWKWNYIDKIPVGKDSSRLETQVELSNLEILAGQDCNLYLHISDWQNKSIDYSDQFNSSTNLSFGSRSNSGSVNYANGGIDAVWDTISMSAEGSITDPDEGGITDTEDIKFTKVCDDGTTINFLVQLWDYVNTPTANICIYIDYDLDGNEDYALHWDVGKNTSRCYQNSTGSWVNVAQKIPSFETCDNGTIEIGIALNDIGSPYNLDYYVTTEVSGPTFELPQSGPDPHGNVIDYAEDLPPTPDYTSYSTNIPEFQFIFLPIISIFGIILLARNRRKKYFIGQTS